MERLLGRELELEEVEDKIIKNFADVFGNLSVVENQKLKAEN
jgi:hypothetical protein